MNPLKKSVSATKLFFQKCVNHLLIDIENEFDNQLQKKLLKKKSFISSLCLVVVFFILMS